MSPSARLVRLASPPLNDDDVIAVVGDACIDVYPAEGCSSIGGNAPNVAVNLRGRGVRSEFLGRVGDDPDGHRLLTGLRARDVIVERVKVTASPTCIGLLETKPNGLTSIIGTCGDCSPFRLEGDDLDRLTSYRHVHLKEVADAAVVFEALATRGVQHSYDYSDTLDDLEVRAADICFFSCGAGGDGIRRAEDAVRTASALGATIAIATLGADGSIGRYLDEEIYIPAVPVTQVDSIGAGDSYIAAVLDELLRGRSPADAMRCGAASASATCAHRAAWPQSFSSRT
jgi:fructoselysine 6-kinase